MPESLRLPTQGLLDKSKSDTKDILSLAKVNLQEGRFGYLGIQLRIIPKVGGYHSKVARKTRTEGCYGSS